MGLYTLNNANVDQLNHLHTYHIIKFYSKIQGKFVFKHSWLLKSWLKVVLHPEHNNFVNSYGDNSLVNE